MHVFLKNMLNSKSYCCCGCLQTELSDGIDTLVASNDHIQALLSQLEEVCHVTEVSLSLSHTDTNTHTDTITHL